MSRGGCVFLINYFSEMTRIYLKFWNRLRSFFPATHYLTKRCDDYS